MSNQKSDAADDILDVIEMGMAKAVSRLRDNFVRTTVKAVSSDFRYTVGINGADYNVVSGCGLEFSVGEQVWVHIPEGDYKKCYICAAATARHLHEEVVVDVTERILANYLNNPGTLPTCTLPTWSANVVDGILKISFTSGSFNPGTLPSHR